MKFNATDLSTVNWLPLSIGGCYGDIARLDRTGVPSADSGRFVVAGFDRACIISADGESSALALVACGLVTDTRAFTPTLQVDAGLFPDYPTYLRHATVDTARRLVFFAMTDYLNCASGIIAFDVVSLTTVTWRLFQRYVNSSSTGRACTTDAAIAAYLSNSLCRSASLPTWENFEPLLGDYSSMAIDVTRSALFVGALSYVAVLRSPDLALLSVVDLAAIGVSFSAMGLQLLPLPSAGRVLALYLNFPFSTFYLFSIATGNLSAPVLARFIPIAYAANQPMLSYSASMVVDAAGGTAYLVFPPLTMSDRCISVYSVDLLALATSTAPIAASALAPLRISAIALLPRGPLDFYSRSVVLDSASAILYIVSKEWPYALLRIAMPSGTVLAAAAPLAGILATGQTYSAASGRLLGIAMSVPTRIAVLQGAAADMGGAILPLPNVSATSSAVLMPTNTTQLAILPDWVYGISLDVDGAGRFAYGLNRVGNAVCPARIDIATFDLSYLEASSGNDYNRAYTPNGGSTVVDDGGGIVAHFVVSQTLPREDPAIIRLNVSSGQHAPIDMVSLGASLPNADDGYILVLVRSAGRAICARNATLLGVSLRAPQPASTIAVTTVAATPLVGIAAVCVSEPGAGEAPLLLVVVSSANAAAGKDGPPGPNSLLLYGAPAAAAPMPLLGGIVLSAASVRGVAAWRCSPAALSNGALTSAILDTAGGAVYLTLPDAGASGPVLSPAYEARVVEPYAGNGSLCVVKLAWRGRADALPVVLGGSLLPQSTRPASVTFVRNGVDALRRSLFLYKRYADGDQRRTGTIVTRLPLDPLAPRLEALHAAGALASGSAATYGFNAPAAPWSCPPRSPLCGAAVARAVFAGAALVLRGSLFGFVPSWSELNISLLRNDAAPPLARASPALISASSSLNATAAGAMLPPPAALSATLPRAEAVSWRAVGGECGDAPPATIPCLFADGRVGIDPTAPDGGVTSLACVLAWGGSTAPARCLRATPYTVRVTLRNVAVAAPETGGGGLDVLVIDGHPLIIAAAPAVALVHNQPLALEVITATPLNVSASGLALVHAQNAAPAAAALDAARASPLWPGDAAALPLLRSRLTEADAGLCAPLTALADADAPAPTPSAPASASARMLVSCVVPPLRERLINVPLAFVLAAVTLPSSDPQLLGTLEGEGGGARNSAAFGTACALCRGTALAHASLARFLYPRPVLYKVTPAAAIAPLGGAVLFVTSPALVSASAPRYRAWIWGNGECAFPTLIAPAVGTISCSAPAGAGSSLPLIVEVDGAFNVSTLGIATPSGSSDDTRSFFSAASFYSTSLTAAGNEVLDASAAPSLDGRTSYSAPQQLLVTPATVQVNASVCGSAALQPPPPRSLLRLVISGASLPPASLASIYVCSDPACAPGGLRAKCAANLANASTGAAASGSVLACFVAAQDLCALSRAAPSASLDSDGELLGAISAALGVSATAALASHFQPAPSGDAASVTSGGAAAGALSLHGRPVVDRLAPNSGPPGALVQALGIAFGVAAADLIAVTVGGVPANNVSWISPTALSFRVPAFDSARMGAGLSGVPVCVASIGGTSACLAPTAPVFSYKGSLSLQWLPAVAAAAINAPPQPADATQLALVLLPSQSLSAAAAARASGALGFTLPIAPTPSIAIAFGAPTSCSLGLLEWQTVAAAAAAANSGSAYWTSLYLNSSVPAGDGGCFVSLADAQEGVSAVASGSGGAPAQVASFTRATISVACAGQAPGALPRRPLLFALSVACTAAAAAATGSAALGAAAVQPLAAVVPALSTAWRGSSAAALRSKPLLPTAADARPLLVDAWLQPWPAAALSAFAVSSGANSSAPRDDGAIAAAAAAPLPATALLAPLSALLQCSTALVSAPPPPGAPPLRVSSDAAARSTCLGGDSESAARLAASGSGPMADVGAAFWAGIDDASAPPPPTLGIELPYISFASAAAATNAFIAAVAGSAMASSALPAVRAAVALAPGYVSSACTWLPLNAAMGAVGCSDNSSCGGAATGADAGVLVRVAAPRAEWSVGVRPALESQALLYPAPQLQLLLPSPAAAALVACTVGACVQGSNVPANACPNASAAASRGSMADAADAIVADSVVIAQALSGATASLAVGNSSAILLGNGSALTIASPSAALTFTSLLIAARRGARLDFSAACTFGPEGFALPVLHAPSSVAGCRPGSEPAGSTGWLCVPCIESTFSGGGEMRCTLCPPVGASCAEGALTLLPGFFLVARPTPPSRRQLSLVSGDAATAIANDGTAAALNGLTALYPCPNPAACTVNASTRTYACAPGYVGLLCGGCDAAAGYVRTGDPALAQCGPPPSSALAGFMIALFALFCVVAVLYLAASEPAIPPSAREGAAPAAAAAAATASSAAAEPSLSRLNVSITLRLLLAQLQTLASLTFLRGAGAAALRQLLSWTPAVSGSPSDIPSLSAALQLSFAGRFILVLFLPAAAVAAAALLRALGAGAVIARCSRGAGALARRGLAHCQKRSLLQSAAPLPRSPEGSDSAAGSARASVAAREIAMADSSLKARRSSEALSLALRAGSSRSAGGSSAVLPLPLPPPPPPSSFASWLAAQSLFVIVAAYMPIVSACILLLDCLPPVDGVALLRADPSLQCGAGIHAPLRALAAAVLVLLGLGLPLLIAWSGVLGRFGSSACAACLCPQPSARLARTIAPLAIGYAAARGTGGWEAVVMARKAALAIAMQLLAGPQLQALVATLVLLAALGAAVGARPFSAAHHNADDSIALVALLLTTIAASAFSLPDAGSPAAQLRDVGIAGAILALNLAVIGRALFLLVARGAGEEIRANVLRRFASVRRRAEPNAAARAAARGGSDGGTGSALLLLTKRPTLSSPQGPRASPAPRRPSTLPTAIGLYNANAGAATIVGRFAKPQRTLLDDPDAVLDAPPARAAAARNMRMRASMVKWAPSSISSAGGSGGDSSSSSSGAGGDGGGNAAAARAVLRSGLQLDVAV